MSEFKKCPKCEEILEKGYLFNVYWANGKPAFPDLPHLKTVGAHRCKNCGYIELYIMEKSKKKKESELKRSLY